MGKLTARGVVTETRRGLHGDGGLLYLRIGPTGAKSWITRVVIAGKRRDVGLGGFPVVTLAEAREKALDVRRAVAEGRDPIAERRTVAETVPTFEEAARRVYETLLPHWKPGSQHARDWIASLENDVFAKIGTRSISGITSGDVLAVLTPIWAGKPETARRVRQRLRQVMAWAKGANFYEGENPVDVAKGSLPRHQKADAEHHAAMPYAALPGFIAELRERQGHSARGVLFAILTAARSGEVRGATWAEVDLAAAVWTIPKERMKAGAEHRVPLSPEALTVLGETRGRPGDLLFPGMKEGEPLSENSLMAVLKRMKRADLTVHGFRSTFRDWAGERSTFPREVAELSLAHAVGDAVERAYARSDLFEKRRKLMAAWARFACSGGSAAAGAKVVRIGA